MRSGPRNAHNPKLIWHGANMGWLLRWGNWAVAKLVEILFNTSHLSDMGCSYRLFNSAWLITSPRR